MNEASRSILRTQKVKYERIEVRNTTDNKELRNQMTEKPEGGLIK